MLEVIMISIGVIVGLFFARFVWWNVEDETMITGTDSKKGKPQCWDMNKNKYVCSSDDRVDEE